MELNRDMDLNEAKGLQGAYESFKAGKLLSLDEMYDIVESRRDLDSPGEKTKPYLVNLKSDEFFKMMIPFQISRVRHVTSEECLRRILHTESFMGNKLKKEPLKDFSYWSAEVGDVPYQEAFDTMRGMVTPAKTILFENEINDQFANSPAFDNSVSRYGNFVFSFPLSDLLERYKVQHCHGGEPQLRVLGTEMYRQEIAHVIMVHSPHIDEYDDLPLVPTLPSDSQSLPSVYWREEDGTLCWRPESTAEKVHMRIPAKNIIYAAKWVCMWNHLVIAFHLPGDQRLVIPEEDLLQNLSTCQASKTYLRDLDTKLPKYKADEILEEVKNR